MRVNKSSLVTVQMADRAPVRSTTVAGEVVLALDKLMQQWDKSHSCPLLHNSYEGKLKKSALIRKSECCATKSLTYSCLSLSVQKKIIQK